MDSFAIVIYFISIVKYTIDCGTLQSDLKEKDSGHENKIPKSDVVCTGECLDDAPGH